MSIKHEIAGLCAFNVKDDPLMKAFSALYSKKRSVSIAAYSEICRILLMCGKSLGDYLYDMAIHSDSPFVTLCAKEESALRGILDNNDVLDEDTRQRAVRNDLRKKAIGCDMVVLARIAENDSSTLKNSLAKHFGDTRFLSLPDFEKGSFMYTTESVLGSVLHSGNGIFSVYKAFRYTKGQLVPVDDLDPIRLSDLKNYDTQRRQVVENTLCFIEGEPAQNVLLYGDRGTGKSATIKAILNEYEMLRMIQLSKNDVGELPELYRILRGNPLKFIISIDDLSFGENDDRFGELKAALEGGLTARPENVLVYATTNRRKIIRETESDREISGADAIDESMSLADRFGLFVTFGKASKEIFLDIVQQLAVDKGIDLDEKTLFAAAERFALKRGGRSPRVARQFVEWLEGRIALGLEY